MYRLLLFTLASCAGAQPAPPTNPPADAGRGEVAAPVADAGVDATDAEAEAPPAPALNLERASIRPALALGAAHTCVLDVAGLVRCVGTNRFGQLGVGSAMGYREFATTIGDPLEGEFVQLASGAHHICALTADGDARCWGHGGFGELARSGDAQFEDAATPVEMPLRDIVQLALGDGVTCALTSDGSVWCAGRNDRRQLGVAGESRSASFVQVPLPPSRVIAYGRHHGCAIGDDGALRCWGENLDGQLGLGTRSAFEAPTVVPIEVQVQSIALGGGESCVRGQSEEHDEVRCWGRNDSAQLGLQGAPSGSALSVVLTPSASPLDVLPVFGSRFSCVHESEGVRCVGLGQHGQMGDGRRRSSASWRNVSLSSPVLELAAGDQHVCVRDGSSVRCWGQGRQGQLGGGNRTRQDRPARMRGITREMLSSP